MQHPADSPGQAAEQWDPHRLPWLPRWGFWGVLGPAVRRGWLCGCVCNPCPPPRSEWLSRMPAPALAASVPAVKRSRWAPEVVSEHVWGVHLCSGGFPASAAAPALLWLPWLRANAPGLCLETSPALPGDRAGDGLCL